MASLSATIGIITSPFRRGLDEMRAQTKKWGSDINGTIAGAFAFGAVSAFVTNFISEMARVQDFADRLGESAVTIQRVGNAAKLSGSDLEFIVKNLSKMTLAAAESADKFAAVGINATAFANAGTEEKLIMLAQAYEDCNGSQAKMLALMDLLGPKGADMMIMLSQGVDQLKKLMNDVPTVGNTTVSAMAKLDDAIDGFHMRAKEALGSVIGLLGHLGAAAAAAWQTVTGNGSFMENYQKNIEPFIDQTPTGGGKKKDFDAQGEQAKQAADEKKKAEAAAKDLDQEMLDLARSRMTAEQKIADLKREQAQHAAAAQDKSKGDVEHLQEAKRVLELQQQIEAAEAEGMKKKQQLEDAQNKRKLEKMDPAQRIAELKRQQDELNKQADADPGTQASIEKKLEVLKLDDQIEAAEKEQHQKNMEGAKAEADLAEEANKQRLAKMNPLERIRELKRQQKELNDAAANDPDAKSRAEKKLEALKLNDEIAAAAKEMEGEGGKKGGPRSVIASSLAAIGGGGRTYVGTDPALSEARRHTSLLQQIAANTSSTGGEGGMPSPKANPF
ncbi:hypothetical protein [Prosthecobacter sp.]|uniref:hypothetical protein n=1 Tax=Prosthecobacter sp. TaxID=1965333 RepID=UPI0037848297